MIKFIHLISLVVFFFYTCKSPDAKVYEKSKSINQGIEMPYGDSIAKLYIEAKWVLYNLNSCDNLGNNEKELSKIVKDYGLESYPLVTCDIFLGYQEIEKDTTILTFGFFKNNSPITNHGELIFHSVRFIGSNIVAVGMGDNIEISFKEVNQERGGCLQYLLTHRDSIDFNPWILKEARQRGIIK